MASRYQRANGFSFGLVIGRVSGEVWCGQADVHRMGGEGCVWEGVVAKPAAHISGSWSRMCRILVLAVPPLVLAVLAEPLLVLAVPPLVLAVPPLVLAVPPLVLAVPPLVLAEVHGLPDWNSGQPWTQSGDGVREGGGRWGASLRGLLRRAGGQVA